MSTRAAFARGDGRRTTDARARVDRAIEKTVTLRACRRIDGLLEI